MTSRLLPPAEYGKLAGTELEGVAAHLPPLAQVLVVEDGEQLAGCWLLFPQWHVEGLWIAPAHRKRAGVARRLWAAMQRQAQAIGARTLMTGSCSAEVTALLEHVGAEKLPGDHYWMRVGG